MEWIERFNGAVEYIEDNLAGTVELAQAAKIALCSPYHFSRMFSYITGIPLGEYLRRRRMSAAALELSGTDAKVVDIALKYGYDSPTAFNRAFQSVHGLPPSAARQAGATLKAYPRLVFSVAIKGDVEMNYRIEEKDAFRVVGAKRSFSINSEESMTKIPLFWGETAQNGGVAKVAMLNDAAPKGVLGVCGTGGEQADNGDGTMDYMIGAASTAAVPEGMAELTVPAATWAIFPDEGPMPDTIQNLQRRIMSEWLPASGYEYGAAPDIEVYLEPARPDGSQPIEIWVPVVKK